MIAPAVFLIDNWAARANCLGMAHPDVMWPLPGADMQIAQARSMCEGCPVAAECVIDGAELGEWDSVRGGYTGAERRRYAQKFGTDVADYPPPPPRMKVCQRCAGMFPLDLANRMARICPPCAHERQVADRRRELKRHTRGTHAGRTTADTYATEWSDR